ncbi:MAG: SDR family oxidoreductase [Cytophagales bacterium]|nr:SDR family oxidoreductase [Cytophagales bacterium]
MQLENKNAIVTGGSSGIGEAIVRKFIFEGANVHVFDLHRPKKELESIGHIAYHHCDVSTERRVNEVVDEIANSGGIDILVNNAGVSHIGNIESTDPNDLDLLMDINIKGVFNCAKACIRYMKKSGGVILNMASIAASVGLKDRFAYALTKGAVLAMTYSIAKDYLDYNIRCNSISPARIHTPFVDGFLKKNYKGKEEEVFEQLAKSQPVGRMGKPEEVAELACFLCSDKASFMTGTDYPIDGGFLKLNS